MAPLRFLFNCAICHEEEKKAQSRLSEWDSCSHKKTDALSDIKSNSQRSNLVLELVWGACHLFIFEDSILLEVWAFGTLHFIFYLKMSPVPNNKYIWVCIRYWELLIWVCTSHSGQRSFFVCCFFFHSRHNLYLHRCCSSTGHETWRQ